MNMFLFSVFSQEPFYFTAFCMVAMILVVMMALGASAIRVVPEYARIVMFRLGRCVGVVGPGLVFLIPLIDRGIQVDLRGKTERINSESTTQDNVRLNIRMNLAYRVVNAEKSILTVINVSDAVSDAARNRLKSIIGNRMYETIIQSRTGLETELKSQLDEAMQLWGCEVNSVDIEEVQKI